MKLGEFTSYQKRVLAILALVNLVNYIDRQVLYPLFPLLRTEFGATYAQLGLLATAFSLVHSFGAFVLGRIADRWSRKKVISYGVLFWSGATFLAGLANSFRSLLFARAMVGVGEAAYTPAATAIISGAFPRSIRARVQGVFDLGMFIGGAAGLVLGGILAERVGWRPAFFIVGIPGLLLGLSILRLPNPPPPARDEQVPLRQILRLPAYAMVLVGGLFLTFAGHTYIAWGATFVHNYKGVGLAEAAVSMGVIVVVAGMLGIIAGAALADRLARRFTWGRSIIVAIGFLVSAPLSFLALETPSKGLFFSLFFLAMFFATWYHGPVTAIIQDLTPPRAHATAMGVYYFFLNLFATVPAFWVAGVIADRYSLLATLRTALAAQVAGAVCFGIVACLIRRQGLYQSAPGSVPSANRPADEAIVLTDVRKEEASVQALAAPLPEQVRSDPQTQRQDEGELKRGGSPGEARGAFESPAWRTTS